MYILVTFILISVVVLYFFVLHLVTIKLADELDYAFNEIPIIIFMIVLISFFIGGYFQFNLHLIKFSALFYFPFAFLSLISLSCLFAKIWNYYESLLPKKAWEKRKSIENQNNKE